MAGKKQSEKNVVFHVTRYNPKDDRAPHVEKYTVPVKPGMTVLDGLHYIKENLAGSLAWRYSCRMGVCGSCGMLLNGKAGLACNTQVQDIADTDLAVGPLPNFKILRDLLPDLRPMFEKHLSLKPFVVREDEADVNDPEGEYYQSPEQLEAYLQFSYCIKCGCCMAACPTLATDAAYLGPMPLTQGHRYNSDTRDGGRRLRNERAGSAHGAFRCHYAGECSRVCPKGVDPAKAIQHMKRRLVLDYLHLARPQKPCAKQHGPGPYPRDPKIPDAPPFTIER